jgi:transcriptional regulator with XRE-family HTH domain
MIVRKLRLQRGWSQDHLARISGLSIRTIQRIERGQSAGLDSLMALAAVFDVDIADLQQQHQEREMPVENDNRMTEEEEQALKYVRDLKGFYSHALTYVCVIGGLLTLNLLTSPHEFWVLWPMLGWGAGLIAHGISVFEIFNLFGPNWEKRQVEKRLGRKL